MLNITPIADDTVNGEDHEDEGSTQKLSRLIEGLKVSNEIPTHSSLDIFRYPHILDNIISHSSKPTLVKLLVCSKSTFTIVSRTLHRNLTITAHRFVKLIGLSTILSPFQYQVYEDKLRPTGHHLEVISNIRYCRFLDDQPINGLPFNLTYSDQLRICMKVKVDILSQRQLTTATRLESNFYQRDLFIHLHRFCDPSIYVDRFGHLLMPMDIGKRPMIGSGMLTVMIPFFPQGVGLLSIVIWDQCPEDRKISDLSITYVLLPERVQSLGSSPSAASVLQYIFGTANCLEDRLIEIVGIEYLAVEPEVWKSVQKAFLERYGQNKKGPIRLTFTTFSSWIEKQEPEFLFSSAHENLLRVRNTKIVSDLVANGKEMEFMFPVKHND